MLCSCSATSDPSLPFLLLSDFDNVRGDGDFKDEDKAFGGISGNGGIGERGGFVHMGDPFVSVPAVNVSY